MLSQGISDGFIFTPGWFVLAVFVVSLKLVWLRPDRDGRAVMETR